MSPKQVKIDFRSMFFTELFKGAFRDVRIAEFQPAPHNPLLHRLRIHLKSFGDLGQAVSCPCLPPFRTQVLRDFNCQPQLGSMVLREVFHGGSRNPRIPNFEPTENDPPLYDSKAYVQKASESSSCISVGNFAPLTQPRKLAPDRIFASVQHLANYVYYVIPRAVQQSTVFTF